MTYQDLLNIGYTPEEARKYLECVKEIELTPKEIEAAVDALNAIGCTSFWMTADEISQIVSTQKTDNAENLQEVENS